MVISRLFMTTLGALLLLVSWTINAAGINVSVFPDPPKLEESFRLIFSSDSKVDDDPDFSPLDGIFDILGQNQSTQVQWINGEHSSTTTWELEVISRKSGDIIIPSITFGSDQSSPTAITVLSGTGNVGLPQDDLLLEIAVDDDTPYVQQQVLLTVRLLRRINLADAKLSDPVTSSDVIIKVLTKDTTYQDTRNSKRYEVFERRFAIYPQASGELTIQPFTVTTQIPRSPRSLFDPFRNTSSTRRIVSNEIRLSVKPVPSAFTGDTWLPARRVELREEWEPPSLQVKSGEPLTRTLFLLGESLTAGQLPEFADIDLPSASIYPDQVQTNEQESENGFLALKQQKFALIANAAGELQIPATKIAWWNITTDALEIASLPARTINVAAGAAPNAEREVAPDTAAADEPSVAQTAEPAPGAAVASTSLLWISLACIALAGWLVTATAWWFSNKRRHKFSSINTEDLEKSKLSTKRLERDISQAASRHDPYALRAALLAWAKHTYPTQAPRSLGALSKLVQPALAHEINALDANLYSNRSAEWDAENLINSFNNNKLHSENSQPTGKQSNLSPIFKLN